MHTKTLTDVISPWLNNLNLPGGPLDRWPISHVTDPDNQFFLRGESHWYTMICGEGDAGSGDWILTVRGDHVEVRDSHDDGPTVVSWHVINAADPDFFGKLEKDLRTALDWLARS